MAKNTLILLTFLLSTLANAGYRFCGNVAQIDGDRLTLESADKSWKLLVRGTEIDAPQKDSSLCVEVSKYTPKRGVWVNRIAQLDSLEGISAVTVCGSRGRLSEVLKVDDGRNYWINGKSEAVASFKKLAPASKVCVNGNSLPSKFNINIVSVGADDSYGSPNNGNEKAAPADDAAGAPNPAPRNPGGNAPDGRHDDGGASIGNAKPKP